MKSKEYLSDLLAWEFDEILSPEEFLQLCAANRDRIKDVRFLFPRVGPGRFGSFAVEYKKNDKVRE
jgi:hypothetical protein